MKSAYCWTNPWAEKSSPSCPWGVGLALLLVKLLAWLRSDMAKVEDRLRQDTKQMRAELRQDINGLRGEVVEARTEVSQLRERMARLDGLLEGLREAITRRATS